MFDITPARRFSHMILLVLLLLVVVGCRRGVAPELPEVVQTSDASAPTFPPTFTPPPSSTPILSPTATLTTTPTVTLTLTPTIQPIPSDTPTVTPTITATWTPDLNTSTPGGPGNTTITGTVTNTGDTTININPPSPGCLGAINNTNLLTNPGFEGGQHEQGQPSLRVPDSWTGFFRPEGTPTDYDPDNGDGYRVPDMQVINSDPPFDDPLRVRTDDHAFYLSGSNKVFDGGVWQQVTVPEDVLLCLTGYAHAWSDHKNDDRSQSLLETDDDKINANFQLGISVTGGTDPFDPNVVWGNVAHLYDTYKAIPAIQGRAEGTTITVFVRGYTKWRFDHNDLFFDDISLLQLSN